MKHTLKTLTLSFAVLVSPIAFSASCNNDQVEMYNQIALYQSISTKGCPFNGQKYGINQVVKVMDVAKICLATCVYAKGSAPSQCMWEKGNWGNTLTCMSSGALSQTSII